MDVTSVPGRRFGLTADTHDDLVDWPAVLTRLRTAWGAVDGVLHCGDISTMTALAGLGEAGPVFATRNNGDPPAAPPGLCDGPRLLEIGGVRVGLMFNLPKDAMTPTGAAALFGGPVAACIFGGTHEPRLEQVGEVLFINPGSPSLAKRRTAAVLTIDDGRASAQIVDVG
jgi:putative phosphoesterase